MTRGMNTEQQGEKESWDSQNHVGRDFHLGWDSGGASGSLASQALPSKGCGCGYLARNSDTAPL